MKEELFAELVASVKEGGAILRGEREPSRSFRLSPVDIKRIRDEFDLTQVEFAALLGISVRTLRNWEQGRRVPEGAAMVLLRVAEKHPEAVLDVIRANDSLTARDGYRHQFPIACSNSNSYSNTDADTHSHSIYYHNINYHA
jgi:putative transcriptional regulator